MWKLSLLTMLLATMLLGGCNWGNRAAEEVNEDVRRGVDKVEDVVDPDRRDDDAYNRNVDGVDRRMLNDNDRVVPEATPPANVDGTTVPNTNGVQRNDTVIEEDVVEKKVDIDKQNNVNTR
ncbi:hypothetical protein [Lysinibacillus piscis]|uniref:Secreted protein n=1 Tax=Lysinibacillus piscis TaxID=2518931 RepID=A0ABQ5NIK7_9BACI|nr:hypothetical protein [Lysinibacillus sp. KH24]GLC87906.1 hypothetical protein LYSBPC_10330 [Lysinibacillus sp. KH24]